MTERDSSQALFAPLQAAIARKNNEDGISTDHPWYHRLIVDESGGLVDVEYRGEYELFAASSRFGELRRLVCTEFRQT